MIQSLKSNVEKDVLKLYVRFTWNVNWKKIKKYSNMSLNVVPKVLVVVENDK